MTVRTSDSLLIRGALWLFAIWFGVVLWGCGQHPTQSPKAAPTAKGDVQAQPETRHDVAAAPAPKVATKPTAPAKKADIAASTPVRDLPKKQSRELPGTPEPKKISVSTAEAPVADLPDSTALEKQLAELEIPPAWLADVQTRYDTSHPWKDARLEIRRLLSLHTDAARKEAIKLTWLYLKKGDIGDGHEYPMYTFLGGEPLWSIRAHQEFLAKPHKVAPDHAYISLASLYTRFKAFDKAKATLDEAMAKLPEPPWRIARQANAHEAFGDLYVAWGKTDAAQEHYAEAIRLFPTSNQPHGQHLLKRQAARVQTKLDLLSVRSLSSARLRDGRYTSTALGYAGDLHVILAVREGRMADIQVKHEEKIDQGACVVVPRQIVDKQSLQVDAISGATVTTNAIIDGTLQCLRKAGLP